MYNKHNRWAMLIVAVLSAIRTSRASLITATAPLAEVEEGAILSLHCRVRDIQPGLEITLFRTLVDKTDRLSVNEVVTLNEDGKEERIFLAVRQLDDGSVVHFLSITKVTRSDSGIYACSLYDTQTGRPREISYDPVQIGVMYFPSEEDPKCSYTSSGTPDSGFEIVLNCSSERANPEVSLSWSSGASDKLKGGTIETYGNRVHAIVKLRPSSGTVYLCTVTSEAFPDRSRTCHIGPLSVSQNTLHNINNPFTLPPPVKRPVTPTTSLIKPLDKTITDCSEICGSDSQSSMWMITTAAIGSVAVFFMILVLLMLCKYYKLNTSNDTFYVSHHTKDPMVVPTEQMYSELEYKRNQNMVYMALAKRDKFAVYQHSDIPVEDDDNIENFRLPQIS
ncbi:uncharacterized protein [Amphiura filiformis]|uniref:uncharacterized protein n=1 Tax=Amphiura filiformis TaxID=82378 RepID=UPI003B2103B8